MFRALDHLILAVRDLEDAARRYAALFGRRPSWRGEHPGQGTANVLFRLENTYLELLAPWGVGPLGEELERFLAERGDGPLGIALATDDAESARAVLAERGLDPAPVEPGMGRDSDSGLFRRWRLLRMPTERTRGVLLLGVEAVTGPELLPPAPAACDPAAAVAGLDHAVVRTRDADAAIALYRDGLGLRLALDRSFPDWGMRLVFFRVGGATLEIAQPLAAGESAGEPADTGRDQFWGLSWSVPDADAARARLADAGLSVSPVRAGRRSGTRVFSVRDGTCGVPTLMIEPARSVPARAAAPRAG